MQRLKVSDGTELAYVVDDFVDPWIPDDEKDTIVMQLGIKAYIPLVPALARHYRVVRFDERGFGSSGLPPGGYRTSTERFGQDVLELADHLGVKRYHHYAAGTAGMAGIALALAHPERLKSLILQCVPYGIEAAVAQRYLQGEKDLGEAVRKAGGLNEWKKRVPGGHQTLDPTRVDERMLRWLKAYRANDPLEAVVGRYSWVATVNLKERIKDIGVPTLVMNMAGSYQVPLEHGEFMARVNPKIKVVTLEGGYGAPNIQLVVPDQVSHTVLDFLASLARTPTPAGSVTFSIVARCPRTGMLGAALATRGLAVGARCPHVRANVGAVVTQAITDPTLGPLAIDLLARGLTAGAALAEVMRGDRFPAYHQVAASHVGVRRVVELLADRGLDSLDQLGEQIIAQTEASMRAAIRDVADGVYTHEVVVEEPQSSRDPIRIPARVEIRGDEITVDFTGASPQVDSPVNCVYNVTYAETVLPIKMALHPHIPYNEGCLSPIKVVVPEGTVLNASFPAPVMLRTLLVYYCVEAVFNALVGIIPDKVLAPSGTYPLWTIYFSGRYDNGKAYLFLFWANGGQGAAYDRDGNSAITFPSNTSNTSVEVFESDTSLLIERKAFIPIAAAPVDTAAV